MGWGRDRGNERGALPRKPHVVAAAAVAGQILLPPSCCCPCELLRNSSLHPASALRAMARVRVQGVAWAVSVGSERGQCGLEAEQSAGCKVNACDESGCIQRKLKKP